MKSGVRYVVAAFAVVMLALVAVRAAVQPLSFTKSVEVDRGTYYRLKVDLTYKGVPAPFDIVVGCNVRQINYRDNSRTVEVGLVPTVFGKRMPDGKGLVVRPPNACNGETSQNGKVPGDLLPIVLVYDDADTFNVGTAYMSEDAYENPHSVLTFQGATIASSDRAEFDTFRREQPNAISRASYHSSLNANAQMGLARAAQSIGLSCQGYMRFRVPEKFSAKVRESWPAEHPKYWHSEIGEVSSLALLSGESGRTDLPGAQERKFSSFLLSESLKNTGLPTRAGAGMIDRPKGIYFPPAYYPARSDTTAVDWSANPADWPHEIAERPVIARRRVSIEGGAQRGFISCTSDAALPHDEIAKKRSPNFADGVQVVQDTMRYPWPVMLIFYEQDEFLYVSVYFSLASTNGDV